MPNDPDSIKILAGLKLKYKKARQDAETQTHKLANCASSAHSAAMA